MLHISRTRIPEDCLLDLNFDKRPTQSLPTSAVEEYPTPKTLQEPTVTVPRSFGSASSTDSDPFPELLPWETLFEATIWARPQSTGHKSVPSDVSCDMLRTNSTESTAIDMSRILDPTSLQCGFPESCLLGLDATLLYSPLESFASVCWEDVIDNRPQEKRDFPETASLNDGSSTLDLEDAFSPKYSAREHIVPMSASLLWSDDSDDDSDECRTYEDDYTPVPTIHGNHSLIAAHPVGSFASFEKEKGLFYRDLTASFGTFEPIFPSFTDPKEAIGHSPIPIVRPTSPKAGVHKRIASFCARLPSRVSATIVR